MTPSRVEQIFLEPRSQQVEALVVLEDEAGARTREKLRFPTRELSVAVRGLARHLSSRGIRPAHKVRLRVGGPQGLRDDQLLLELFLIQFDE